jgi:hypothetical protein
MERKSKYSGGDRIFDSGRLALREKLNFTDFPSFKIKAVIFDLKCEKK